MSYTYGSVPHPDEPFPPVESLLQCGIVKPARMWRVGKKKRAVPNPYSAVPFNPGRGWGMREMRGVTLEGSSALLQDTVPCADVKFL